MESAATVAAGGKRKCCLSVGSDPRARCVMSVCEWLEEKKKRWFGYIRNWKNGMREWKRKLLMEIFFRDVLLLAGNRNGRENVVFCFERFIWHYMCIQKHSSCCWRSIIFPLVQPFRTNNRHACIYTCIVIKSRRRSVPRLQLRNHKSADKNP